MVFGSKFSINIDRFDKNSPYTTYENYAITPINRNTGRYKLKKLPTTSSSMQKSKRGRKPVDKSSKISNVSTTNTKLLQSYSPEDLFRPMKNRRADKEKAYMMECLEEYRKREHSNNSPIASKNDTLITLSQQSNSPTKGHEDELVALKNYKFFKPTKAIIEKQNVKKDKKRMRLSYIEKVDEPHLNTKRQFSEMEEQFFKHKALCTPDTILFMKENNEMYLFGDDSKIVTDFLSSSQNQNETKTAVMYESSASLHSNLRYVKFGLQNFISHICPKLLQTTERKLAILDCILARNHLGNEKKHDSLIYLTPSTALYNLHNEIIHPLGTLSVILVGEVNGCDSITLMNIDILAQTHEIYEFSVQTNEDTITTIVNNVEKLLNHWMPVEIFATELDGSYPLTKVLNERIDLYSLDRFEWDNTKVRVNRIPIILNGKKRFADQETLIIDKIYALAIKDKPTKIQIAHELELNVMTANHLNIWSAYNIVIQFLDELNLQCFADHLFLQGGLNAPILHPQRWLKTTHSPHTHLSRVTKLIRSFGLNDESYNNITSTALKRDYFSFFAHKLTTNDNGFYFSKPKTYPGHLVFCHFLQEPTQDLTLLEGRLDIVGELIQLKSTAPLQCLNIKSLPIITSSNAFENEPRNLYASLHDICQLWSGYYEPHSDYSKNFDNNMNKGGQCLYFAWCRIMYGLARPNEIYDLFQTLFQSHKLALELVREEIGGKLYHEVLAKIVHEITYIVKQLKYDLIESGLVSENALRTNDLENIFNPPIFISHDKNNVNNENTNIKGRDILHEFSQCTVPRILEMRFSKISLTHNIERHIESVISKTMLDLTRKTIKQKPKRSSDEYDETTHYMDLYREEWCENNAVMMYGTKIESFAFKISKAVIKEMNPKMLRTLTLWREGVDYNLYKDDKIQKFELELQIWSHDFTSEFEHAWKTFQIYLTQNYAIHFELFFKTLGLLDCYMCMALISGQPGWSRPFYIQHSKILHVEGGHNPLVGLPNDCVTNDTLLDMENRPLILLTGAHGSGKSSYLLSLFHMAWLAQIGCYVPALKYITATYDVLAYVLSGISSSNTENHTMTAYNFGGVSRTLNAITQNSLVFFDDNYSQGVYNDKWLETNSSMSFEALKSSSFNLSYAALYYIHKMIKCLCIFATCDTQILDTSFLDLFVSPHIVTCQMSIVIESEMILIPTSGGILRTENLKNCNNLTLITESNSFCMNDDIEFFAQPTNTENSQQMLHTTIASNKKVNCNITYLYKCMEYRGKPTHYELQNQIQPFTVAPEAAPNEKTAIFDDILANKEKLCPKQHGEEISKNVSIPTTNRSALMIEKMVEKWNTSSSHKKDFTSIETILHGLHELHSMDNKNE